MMKPKEKKKCGPRGPRADSAATMFRKLIKAGRLGDVAIAAAVKRKFPKLKARKNMVGWYRWQMSKTTLRKAL